MNTVEVIDTGYVSRDDAAFPTMAVSDSGEIICAYTAKGDGPNALGGTDWSVSSDSGSTWVYGGTILPREENPVRSNSLRISRVSEGTIFAYGSRDYLKGDGSARKFGDYTNEPVVCRSVDSGRSWSEVTVIPSGLAETYEISNPIVEAGNGVLLAPAATLPDSKRLGERVVVFRSEDNGKTWPEYSTVFHDSEGKKGFFEQKIISVGEGRLLAVAWTVTLGDYKDLENHFSISDDYGVTWSPALPTGIKGQTLSPLYLGEDRLFLLSNRRYGNQGVAAYFARFNAEGWVIEGDSLLWDARSSRNAETENTSGIDAFDDFAFGLPSAVRIGENLFLSVHWCREEGIYGIRWTKFREV